MNALPRQPFTGEAKSLIHADLEKIFPVSSELPFHLQTLLEQLEPKPPPERDKN